MANFEQTADIHVYRNDPACEGLRWFQYPPSLHIATYKAQGWVDQVLPWEQGTLYPNIPHPEAVKQVRAQHPDDLLVFLDDLDSTVAREAASRPAAGPTLRYASVKRDRQRAGGGFTRLHLQEKTMAHTALDLTHYHLGKFNILTGATKTRITKLVHEHDKGWPQRMLMQAANRFNIFWVAVQTVDSERIQIMRKDGTLLTIEYPGSLPI